MLYDVAMKFQNDCVASISLYLEFIGGAHLQMTPLKTTYTYPNDAAIVGNIFGTPVVE
jgi:hypothetical protein